MLAALSSRGVEAVMASDGATVAEVCRVYVAQVLLPTLRPGDIVIMDNRRVHKALGIREAIEQFGAPIWYFPPYSPDLSPWTPGRDVSGDPVVRIRFAMATCRACPVRQACTWAKDAPRQLTVRPQAHHEALHGARQRQEIASFKAQYARRAGVERTHAQGVRRCGLRRARYIGLAKPHLQHLITAMALHVVRSGEWWLGIPVAKTCRSPFAALRAATA